MNPKKTVYILQKLTFKVKNKGVHNDHQILFKW